MGEIVPTTWVNYKRALRCRTESARELDRAAAAMRRLAVLAPRSGAAEIAPERLSVLQTRMGWIGTE